MARVKLALPEHFPFATTIAVRISDINYGGHLSNDAVLSIMHEARLQFLQHYGLTELDIGGASIIMGDCAIVYKAEGFHGDQIKVEVAAGEFTRVGFDLFYRLTKVADGKEIAHGKTGIVCFNYDTRKVVEVPDSFKERF